MAGYRRDHEDEDQPDDCARWLADRGLEDASVLALIPNEVMDRLTGSQRGRVHVLLESLHRLQRHHGPLARELCQRAQLELDRLLS